MTGAAHNCGQHHKPVGQARRTWFPVFLLVAKVSLGVGALSYAGRFDMMAVADADACPDLDVFAPSARDELQALAIGEKANRDPTNSQATQSPKSEGSR